MVRASILLVAVIFLVAGCVVPIENLESEYDQRPIPCVESDTCVLESSDTLVLPKDLNCNCETESVDSDCIYWYGHACSDCAVRYNYDVRPDLRCFYENYEIYTGYLYCGVDNTHYEHDNGRTVHATDIESIVVYGDGDTNDVYVSAYTESFSSGDFNAEDGCALGGANPDCLLEVSLTSLRNNVSLLVSLWSSNAVFHGYRACVSP